MQYLDILQTERRIIEQLFLLVLLHRKMFSDEPRPL